MTHGAPAAAHQLATRFYLIVIGLVKQSRHCHDVWLRSDQLTDVDELVEALVVDDAGVGFTDLLSLVEVGADEDGGEHEPVHALLVVSGHVSGVTKGMFSGGSCVVTVEHHPCHPLLSMISSLITWLSNKRFVLL